MVRQHHIQIFRRRREGKTDYRKRKAIIVGKSPFLSVRISGRYVYAQLMKPAAGGDTTICSASSKDIASKFGWKGSTKSIPGAYLTGLYLGRIAGEKDVSKAIVYSGIDRYIHGSRLASVINGARDAGLEVAVDEESLPDESRLNGTHIVNYAKKLESEDKERYMRSFSKMISRGLNPSQYPAHFQEVKKAIQSNAK